MKPVAALALLVFFLAPDLRAQSDSTIIIFTNSQPVRGNRYFDVKGSPYLFEDFVYGNIISSRIDVYENLAVNLNGYTKNFEVRRGNNIIELDQRWYLRVEIDPEVNPSLVNDFGEEKIVFQRGIHPKLENVFAQVLCVGTRTVFLKTYHADLSKKKVQDVGKTLEFQRFIGKFTYYVIKDGELLTVLPRKKNFLKALGADQGLEAFADEQNLDFGSEADLIKLVKFYDKSL